VQLEKCRIRHAQIVFGIDKHDPEVIIDHIEGDLTFADRTVDEGHDNVMRVVQQELVARTRGDLFKRDKRIGAQILIIPHSMRALQPLGFYKKLLDALEFCVIEVKDHMGLMDDGGVDLPETIVNPFDTGVVIGTHGGNQINRFAGRRLRAEHFIVFVRGRSKFNMGQKQMFIEVARGHAVLGVIQVQKCFPLFDGQGIGGFRYGKRLLLGGVRPFRAGNQPARDDIEFFGLERGKTEGHAAVRVFFQVSSEFLGVLGTGQIIGFRAILSDAFRVFHLVGKNLNHDRIVQPGRRTAFGHAEKFFLAPLPGRLGVGEKTGGIHGSQP